MPMLVLLLLLSISGEQGMTADDLAHDIASTGKPVAVVNMRGAGGLIHATEQATRYAADYSRMLSDMRRESAPLSKLLFGTECGTSDTTSGLAGNPATGVCMEKIIADMVVVAFWPNVRNGWAAKTG